MSEFLLDSDQIQKNWEDFRKLINNNFPTRKDSLNKLYDDMELDERIQIAPASSYKHFHNAIYGGYVDHVLRVHDFAIATYELWRKMGMMVDNFTKEELSFAAMHHDLGKLGLPGEGREKYQTETEKWWKETRGRMFKPNPDLPWMPTSDVTFYLMNKYEITYSLNEMLGIKLTDGLYDETSKPYFINYDLDNKLRNNMPYILHHADMMASRFEFERWANNAKTFVFNNEEGKTHNKKSESVVEKPVADILANFDAFLKNKTV